MTTTRAFHLSLAAAGLLALLPAGSIAQEASGSSEETHAHDDHAHDHDHGHDHGSEDIYNGYFDDSQIEPRPLSDWEGDWQSVYPYLLDGTLDGVMEHKAAHGERSEEEYLAYYQTGYETDVDRIEIDDGEVAFHTEDGVVSGSYVDDGYEVLTYEAGNRGVRYIFEKAGGDNDAPGFIQFSDHRIAPADADHYHLYWGDDRSALLEEVTNWPTYYPATLSGEDIVREMKAH